MLWDLEPVDVVGIGSEDAVGLGSVNVVIMLGL